MTVTTKPNQAIAIGHVIILAILLSKADVPMRLLLRINGGTINSNIPLASKKTNFSIRSGKEI